ncbi:MAG: ABC-three component system protein [Pseudomonadales bacterium]
MRKIKKDNPKLSRNLEQKLLDGEKHHVIPFAKECKHKINKKISKYGLFRTANDVFVYLLGHIETKFLTTIKSRICSKRFEIYEIDDLIESEIISKLWGDCQHSSLFDNFDELYGLLYLLTGNCHIDWDIEV